MSTRADPVVAGNGQGGGMDNDNTSGSTWLQGLAIIIVPLLVIAIGFVITIAVGMHKLQKDIDEHQSLPTPVAHGVSA